MTLDARLRELELEAQDVFQKTRWVLATNALARGDLRAALGIMHNDLEPPARRLSPDVAALLGALAAAGAAGPMLTGSGSACFALSRSRTEARAIAARLLAAGWPGVFVVRVGGWPGV